MGFITSSSSGKHLLIDSKLTKETHYEPTTHFNIIYPNITVIMLTRLLNEVNSDRIDIESPEDAINEVLNHFI